MAVRSTIAILNKNGSVQSVSSLFSGGLPDNGSILYEHYKDVDKVRQLIALGSVSSLAKELIPPSGVSHTLNKAYPGVTTFFGRDGNSDHSFVSSFQSLEEYVKNGDLERYNYIFKEKTNQWYFMNMKGIYLKRLDATLLNNSQVKDTFKAMINSVKLSKKLDKTMKVKNTIEIKSKI